MAFLGLKHMLIKISLQRSFLRAKFSKVRRVLGGSWLKKQSFGLSHESLQKGKKWYQKFTNIYKKSHKNIDGYSKKPAHQVRQTKKSTDTSKKGEVTLLPGKTNSTPPDKTPQVKNVALNNKPSKLAQQGKNGLTWRSAVFAFFMSCSVAILAFLVIPVVYYRFFNHEVVPVSTSDKGTPLGGEFSQGTQNTPKIPEPSRDESLPEGNWLIIPRIGVRTEVLENQNPDEALVKGVWRVPDFGTAGDQTKPMILAAHRYGYNWWWKGEYWKYHSFYLLPELQPGDIVEVISNKRKYIYEIYSGEEGQEITDYDADLILYTCKFLTSPVRHFRYARLVDPTTYLSTSAEKSKNSAASSAAPSVNSAVTASPSGNVASPSAH
jgi:sortase (surface protein transpeptidase)